MWSAQAVRESKITLIAIYAPSAEPEAHNSALGWHWDTLIQVGVVFRFTVLILYNKRFDSIDNILILDSWFLVLFLQSVCVCSNAYPTALWC